MKKVLVLVFAIFVSNSFLLASETPFLTKQKDELQKVDEKIEKYKKE